MCRIREQGVEKSNGQAGYKGQHHEYGLNNSGVVELKSGTGVYDGA